MEHARQLFKEGSEFLPGDCLLGFAFADFLEAQGDTSAACDVYHALLKVCTEQKSFHAHSAHHRQSLNQTLLRFLQAEGNDKVTLVYIQFMKFARRTVGFQRSKAPAQAGERQPLSFRDVGLG